MNTTQIWKRLLASAGQYPPYEMTGLHVSEIEAAKGGDCTAHTKRRLPAPSFPRTWESRTRQVLLDTTLDPRVRGDDALRSRSCRKRLQAIVIGTVIVCGLFAVPAHAQEITTLAQAINLAQEYTLGDSGTAMEFIRTEVFKVQLNPEARNELANTLAALLDDASSTDAFKAFVCKQLYLIGGEDQIDAVLPMLLNPKYAHLARYALENIPSPRIDDALWAAIPKVDGKVAAGMVSSLVARGGADATARLTQLLLHGDEEVLTAAIIGLGRLGGAPAELALRQAHDTLPEELRTVIFEALLSCADAYARSGNPVGATRLYQELMLPDLPLFVRLGALHGVVDVQGEQSVPLLLEALNSGDIPWVTAVLGYVRTVGGPAATEAFGAQLSNLTPDVQVALIQALADRGDPTALNLVMAALGSPDLLVQQAVLSALGALGNEIQVNLLVDAMMEEDKVLSDPSRVSLTRMADAGVDGALLRTIDENDPEAQSAIMEVLAARRATSALPRLLQAVNEESGAVQASAFKAMGRLARVEDIPVLYDAYLAMSSEDTRKEAARALTAAYRRVPQSPSRTEMLTAMYAEAPSVVCKGELLNLYRELGDDTLLPLVLTTTHASDSLEQQSGVDALVGWKTATPMTDVMALAKAARDDGRIKSALGGYIRMLRLPSERPAESSLAGLEDVLLLSNDAGIVRRVLAALSELESIAALELAENLMGRTDIRKEAAIAAEKIRQNFYTVTASVNGESARNAADGSIYSFWETGGSQEPGQWLEIDMSRPARIKGIVLDTSRTKNSYPRGYAVYVYEKGGAMGEAIATGEGKAGVTKIEFEATTGQIVRVVQTGTSRETGWVIHEARIIPE